MTTITIDPATTTAARPGAAARMADTGILFEGGIPGFARIERWELVTSDDAAPFLWLRPEGDETLRLLVVDPLRVGIDYRPQLSAADLSRVKLAPDDPRVVLAVVTLVGTSGATVNLRAPLVINPRTMRGTQIILEGAHWPLRRSLTEVDGT